MEKNKLYQIKNLANGNAEIYITGEILSENDSWIEEDGDNILTNFLDTLKTLKDVQNLDIHINSVGGDLFAGVQMYNCLKQLKAHKTVYIDALGASSASIIAMAGDKIVMASGSFLMIHKPSVGAYGNADDLRDTAETLDKLEDSMLAIYETNLAENVSVDNIKELVDAESWLTGEEASKYFKNIEISEQLKAVAKANFNFENFNYKQIPDSLLVQNQKSEKINSHEDKTNLKDNEINEKMEKELENALKEYEVFLEINK